ncbi:MAG: histidine kinase dimerization/phosphoacceptor domain -containing protein [Candidatus Aminicenantales bacterium]|jgi:PAS domain S-box-containing protein
MDRQRKGSDAKSEESPPAAPGFCLSPEQILALINAIPDIVYFKDGERRNRIVNKAFIDAFGLSIEAVAGMRDEEFLPADLASACRNSDEIVLRSGKPYRFEETSVGPDGIERDFETIKAPVFDGNGRITDLVGVSRDITEQKKARRALETALAEKSMLLKEIHHRVKNNMQVISSLLNLQSRYLKHPDDVELFKESQRRIRSMALIHEMLYQSKSLSRIEFGAYIGNLMDTLRGSMDDSRGLITYRKELEEVRLDIQTAIPCGFIVNELVSNALKHAFPGGRGGEVFVSLRQEKDGSVILTVQDDGIGLPPGTSLKAMDSMGMQLVMMLVQQIDGTIRTEDGPGAKFVLIFRELKYKPRI